MILSASVRTDIPALYSTWFMNRLRAGYVLVRNPYNEHLISYIDIAKDIVDCIVFCTKDPQNMIKYIDEMDELGYKYYFNVTITPYHQDIEPNLRAKEMIEDSFIELSKKIGRDKITWRYDPILINNTYSIETHINEFKRMCQKLSPYTKIVIISFIDIYQNIVDKFQSLTMQQIDILASEFGKIAREFQLEIQTCAENYDLSKYGIRNTACINSEIIEKIVGLPIDIKTNPNRNNCSCLTSIDIGAYDSCNHGCTYCYACNNNSKVINNMRNHDTNGELLFGQVNIEDKVVKRKVSSNKIKQLSFNFD